MIFLINTCDTDKRGELEGRKTINTFVPVSDFSREGVAVLPSVPLTYKGGELCTANTFVAIVPKKKRRHFTVRSVVASVRADTLWVLMRQQDSVPTSKMETTLAPISKTVSTLHRVSSDCLRYECCTSCEKRSGI